MVPLQQTEEQRVITFQEPPLQRVSTAPPTVLANNPTAPCILRTKPRTHQQKTRANTSGALPSIQRSHLIPPSGPPLPRTPTSKQPLEEQRLVPLQQTEEQRVITFQEPPLQRVSTAPPTVLANNPTAPCILRTKPRTHQQKTRANTPGALPSIQRSHLIPPILAPAPTVPTAKQIQVKKKRAQQTILSTDDKTPRR